jgi:hypothetical protein
MVETFRCLFPNVFAQVHRSRPQSNICIWLAIFNLDLILGYHPHGFISMGAFGNFATEATGFEELFPRITNTLLTLNANFRMPLYKDYVQALGIASVSRRSCEALLCGDL